MTSEEVRPPFFFSSEAVGVVTTSALFVSEAEELESVSTTWLLVEVVFDVAEIDFVLLERSVGVLVDDDDVVDAATLAVEQYPL